MFRWKTAFVVVAAVSAIADAAAGEVSNAPTTLAAAVKAKPKSNGDDVICKTAETTGTRLGARKICHMRDDWVVINAASYESVNHTQMQTVAPH